MHQTLASERVPRRAENFEMWSVFREVFRLRCRHALYLLWITNMVESGEP